MTQNTAIRDIIINSSNEETRIAICENNRLAEVYIEQPDNERMIGDIYKGKVAKIIPGIKGIFVDIGFPNDAFLHFSDFEYTMGDFINDDDYEEDDEDADLPVKNRDKRKEYVDPTKHIKVGDDILVQIIKEPISNKGPRVSTKLTIAGRFVVLLPNEQHIGVSKKIESRKERGRLRKLIKESLPKGFGIIMRTVCANKSDELIKNDIKHLLKRWKDIERKAKVHPVRSCIYADSGMSASIIRDFFNEEVNQLIVDTRKEYKLLKNYIKDVAPELLHKLIYYKGKLPIFDVYHNIEKDLQRSLEKKVWMKNGGYLFIEHTEALTSIDINSGRFAGKTNQDDNSLKINCDSAEEIARQIRLRDLGGLIIIDFIDMTRDDYRHRVFQAFKHEMEKDRAVYTMADMSRFCLVELTRKRIRESIEYAVSDTCPRCHGSGIIPSKETVLSRIERSLRRIRAIKNYRKLKIRVSPQMYDYLSEGLLNRANRLMWKYWMILDFECEESLLNEHYHIFDRKMNKINTKEIIEHA